MHKSYTLDLYVTQHVFKTQLIMMKSFVCFSFQVIFVSQQLFLFPKLNGLWVNSDQKVSTQLVLIDRQRLNGEKSYYKINPYSGEEMSLWIKNRLGTGIKLNDLLWKEAGFHHNNVDFQHLQDYFTMRVSMHEVIFRIYLM